MMPSSVKEEKEERPAQSRPLLPTTMPLEDLMIARMWPLRLLRRLEVMLGLVLPVDLEEGMSLAMSSLRIPLLTMACLMARL